MSNYCSQVGQDPIITVTTPAGTDGTVDEQTSVTVLAAIISGDISVSQQGGKCYGYIINFICVIYSIIQTIRC